VRIQKPFRRAEDDWRHDLAIDYEMAQTSGSGSIPHSRYGAVIPVLREMGWDIDQYMAAPYDLIDEIEIEIQAAAKARDG
jgi:hypothetical protein